ncbi:hypothetical protein CDAR_598521 [Caerostris darwini]|uniref:Uncharacterized protein n=1 Tax=Caerostris darwini TaxID=1538125 RepID=A0AAV4W573_9ARAC|nr:hypothetical protein CDAR_598521 [Caerostris darwini]
MIGCCSSGEKSSKKESPSISESDAGTSSIISIIRKRKVFLQQRNYLQYLLSNLLQISSLKKSFGTTYTEVDSWINSI